LPAKGFQVFPIRLANEWIGRAEFGTKGHTKVRIKAIYELAVSEASERFKVWTGRIESESAEFQVNHY